jgi:hypothetical protein
LCIAIWEKLFPIFHYIAYSSILKNVINKCYFNTRQLPLNLMFTSNANTSFHMIYGNKVFCSKYCWSLPEFPLSFTEKKISSRRLKINNSLCTFPLSGCAVDGAIKNVNLLFSYYLFLIASFNFGIIPKAIKKGGIKKKSSWYFFFSWG